MLVSKMLAPVSTAPQDNIATAAPANQVNAPIKFAPTGASASPQADSASTTPAPISHAPLGSVAAVLATPILARVAVPAAKLAGTDTVSPTTATSLAAPWVKFARTPPVYRTVATTNNVLLVNSVAADNASKPVPLCHVATDLFAKMESARRTHALASPVNPTRSV